MIILNKIHELGHSHGHNHGHNHGHKKLGHKKLGHGLSPAAAAVAAAIRKISSFQTFFSTILELSLLFLFFIVAFIATTATLTCLSSCLSSCAPFTTYVYDLDNDSIIRRKTILTPTTITTTSISSSSAPLSLPFLVCALSTTRTAALSTTITARATRTNSLFSTITTTSATPHSPTNTITNNRHHHRHHHQYIATRRNIVIMSAKTKSSSNKDDDNNNSNNNKDMQVPLSFVSKDLLPSWMNQERIKILHQPTTTTITATKNSNDNDDKCVYYWMQRELRTQDNWALLFAQHLAQSHNIPLRVIYVLPCPYPTSTNNYDNDNNMPPKVSEMNMTKRHGSFLIGGLQIVQKELNEKHVPLHILQSNSHLNVGTIVHDFIMGRRGNHSNDTTTATTTASSSTTNGGTSKSNQLASFLICDMNPLRQYREWVEDQATPLMKESGIPFYQVDAHNVVPVWFASPKREVGARTLRPKINKLLPTFLTHFPKFDGNKHLKDSSTFMISTTKENPINWDECTTFLDLDEAVPAVPWAKPGSKAAMDRFHEFCSSKTQGLKNFDSLRNDPNYDKVCSNLSPWVNYGMVSFQRLALEVRALQKYPNGTASYLEEGIVRRELSDNFVYYSKDNYDDLTTAAGWAQETLEVHSSDTRENVYSLQELEHAETHDDLWNAAQLQLTTEGHMHGFLRMYWAKKILEWTESPDVALRTGLYFNDRFALDGNDPNGFTGVGWSIMGIHDMGWKERPIFGKIRYMNYAGCKRKFKVDSFVAKYRNAKVNAIKAEARAGGESSRNVSKKRKASST